MKTTALWSAMLLSTVAAYGCGTDDTREIDLQHTGFETADTAPEADMDPAAAGREEITVELIDAQGQSVGTARLTEAGQGVQIAIEARGLPPGARGIHFHETGRCDPPSFESAGDHFDPTDRQHGLENPQGPHAGDMENLTVGEDGAVNTTLTTTRVTLRPNQQNSLLDGDGSALVIHAGRDDQRTDPSGNSGDRIVCGVVTRAGTAGAR